MTKSYIYIDQNIIGFQANGVIDLSNNDNIIPVYSQEHFSEIRRSSEPQKFIQALDDMNAQMVKITPSENLPISNNAQYITKPPKELYDNYIDSIDGFEDAPNLYHPLQVWLNGGGDKTTLENLPQTIIDNISELVGDDYNDVYLENFKNTFQETIDQIVSYGNDIQNTRKLLGNTKGRIGNIKGENVLKQIWEIIEPNIENLTMDQFFGFSPLPYCNQGYDEYPLFLSIVGCCGVLDVVGYNSEKKCRKLNKLPNVQSDHTHIGMGIFCNGIMSNDEKLINRAKAIYEYCNIHTQPILLTLNK